MLVDPHLSQQHVSNIYSAYRRTLLSELFVPVCAKDFVVSHLQMIRKEGKKRAAANLMLAKI